jgi:hypothetical protein
VDGHEGPSGDRPTWDPAAAGVCAGRGARGGCAASSVSVQDVGHAAREGCSCEQEFVCAWLSVHLQVTWAVPAGDH